MAEPEFEISSEHLEQAKGLNFVSHGDGGPCVIAPLSLLPKYWGMLNRAGELISEAYGGPASHYEKICAVRGNIKKMLKKEVFVLPESGSTAFFASKDGPRLVRWVGADTAAGVLATALHPSPQKKGRGRKWRVHPEPYVLFHAGADGRELLPFVEAALKEGKKAGLSDEEPFAIVDIPEGEYKFFEFHDNGTALHPDGTREGVMVESLHFERVGDLPEEKLAKKSAAKEKPAKEKPAKKPLSDAPDGAPPIRLKKLYDELPFPAGTGGLMTRTVQKAVELSWQPGEPVTLEHFSLGGHRMCPPAMDIRSAVAHLGGTAKPTERGTWTWDFADTVNESLVYKIEALVQALFPAERDAVQALLLRLLHSNTVTKQTMGLAGLRWALHVGAPYWTEAAGYPELAARLRAVDAITSSADLLTLVPLMAEVETALATGLRKSQEKWSDFEATAARDAGKHAFMRSGGALSWALSNSWYDNLSEESASADVSQARANLMWLGRDGASIMATRGLPGIQVPKSRSIDNARRLQSVLVDRMEPAIAAIPQSGVALLDELLPT